MRLGIILSIMAVPLCAQATICEQWLATSSILEAARRHAVQEWRQRPYIRRASDWLSGERMPEATLIIEKEKLTPDIKNHFDKMFPVDGKRVKLIRYLQPARIAFEELKNFETTKLEKLELSGEYALHLTDSNVRPSYLAGKILHKWNDGSFNFIDFKSRTLTRIYPAEFISAKTADLGGLPPQDPPKVGGNKNWLWENNSAVTLLDAVKLKMEKHGSVSLLVLDGTSYGVYGYHVIPLMDIAQIQVQGNGLAIPELGINVAQNQVRAISHK